jgi:hypothetical protein
VSEGPPKNLGEIFLPFKVCQAGRFARGHSRKKICTGDSATMQLDKEVLDHNMFCLLF